MNGSERMKESKSLENLKVEEFMYVSTKDGTKGRKDLVCLLYTSPSPRDA